MIEKLDDNKGNILVTDIIRFDSYILDNSKKFNILFASDYGSYLKLNRVRFMYLFN